MCLTEIYMYILNYGIVFRLADTIKYCLNLNQNRQISYSLKYAGRASRYRTHWSTLSEQADLVFTEVHCQNKHISYSLKYAARTSRSRTEVRCQNKQIRALPEQADTCTARTSRFSTLPEKADTYTARTSRSRTEVHCQNKQISTLPEQADTTYTARTSRFSTLSEQADLVHCQNKQI